MEQFKCPTGQDNFNSENLGTHNSAISLTFPDCDLPSEYFTGRSGFIVDLHSALTEDPGDRLVVVTGTRGIGKSETIKKYIVNYNEFYDRNVVWINGDTVESILNSFMTMARQLFDDFVCVEDELFLLSQVYRHFSDHFQNGLFIFDNVKQMESNCDHFGILDFLPQEPLDNFPFIVVILDNEEEFNLRLGIKRRQLGPFNEDESKEFLHKALTSQLRTDEEKTLHELMGGHPLSLNLFVTTNMDEKSAGQDLKDKMENYLLEFQKNKEIIQVKYGTENNYDQILLTIWQVFLNNKNDPVLQTILSLIGIMPTDCLSVEFCHFFIQDVKLTHRILSELKIEDAKVAQDVLDMLQKHSIVSVQKRTLLGDQLTFNSFVPSWEIRVDSLAQKWTRNTCNNTECWLKLVKYIEQNYNFLNFSVFWDTIQENLTERKFWSPGIHRHYIFFAINLMREAREESTRMLKTIYDVSLINDCVSSDLEYFDLCRMALILSHHEGVFSNLDSEDQIIDNLEDLLDNSSLLESSDSMCHISLQNFIDWVIEQAIQYIENQLIQKIAADIYLSCHNYILNDVTGEKQKKRLTEWTTKYHNAMQSKTNIISYNSWRTSASVFLISKDSQILDTTELTLTLVKTLEAHNSDEFNCWEYLYETTRFWDDWIVRAWEKLFSVDSRDIEASKVKKLFLESGGLKLLTKGLEWISSNEMEDIKYTVIHFCEIIRDFVYFNDCRSLLLESAEFTVSFGQVFKSVLTENISKTHVKVVAAVLLSWFAIYAEEKIVDCKSVCVESMNGFYDLFANNDQLYSDIRHSVRYSSGSREILEKFLKCHDGSALISYTLADELHKHKC